MREIKCHGYMKIILQLFDEIVFLVKDFRLKK